MFKLNQPASELSKITVVGNFLNYKDYFIYLLNPNPYTEISPMCDDLDLVEQGAGDGFIHMLNNDIQKSKTWGENETQYKEAFASDDAAIRALVALNGKHLAEAVKDKDAVVRLHAVKYFHYCKDYNLPHQDTEVLTPLLHDENDNIRIHLARLNEDTLNNTLITDPNPDVRSQIAYSSNDKHLELLSKDADEGVRAAIGRRGLFTELLAKDKSAVVRMNVASAASAEDIEKTALASDEEPQVRHQLALRGIFLDTLLTDNHPKVRLAAKQASLSPNPFV